MIVLHSSSLKFGRKITHGTHKSIKSVCVKRRNAKQKQHLQLHFGCQCSKLNCGSQQSVLINHIQLLLCISCHICKFQRQGMTTFFCIFLYFPFSVTKTLHFILDVKVNHRALLTICKQKKCWLKMLLRTKEYVMKENKIQINSKLFSLNIIR